MAPHVQFGCYEFKMYALTRLVVAILVCIGVSSILRAESRPEVFYQSTHLQPVTAIATTPDGRYAVSSSEDRTMKLWNLDTGKLERNIDLGRFNSPVGIAVSPDDRYAFTSNQEGIRQWQITTGLLFRTFTGTPLTKNSPAFTSYFISMSPNGRQLLCGSSHHRFGLWDIATGRQIQSFFMAEHYANYAVFSPDGTKALSEESSTAGTSLALWNVATGGIILHLVLPYDLEGWKRSGGPNLTRVPERVKAGFSPRGDRIIVGDDGGLVRVYDTSSGLLLKSFPVFSEAVLALVVLPDGNVIAATGKKVALLDTADGRQLKIYEQGDGLPNNVYSASQKFLLIGTTDGGLRVWDVHAAVQVFAFKQVSIPQSVAVSPNGRFGAVQYASSLAVWDLASGTQLKRIDSHLRHVPISGFDNAPDTDLAFSPDGLHVATFGIPRTLEVWNISTGQKLYSVEPLIYPMAVAYSPDGQYILLTAASGPAKYPDGNEFELRRADTGVLLRTFRFGKSQKVSVPKATNEGPFMYVLTATFSPDSKSILVGDGVSLMWWDISADKMLRRFDIPEFCDLEKKPDSPSQHLTSKRVCFPASGPVNAANFSPDGKLLGTAFEQGGVGSLMVWEVEGGKLVRVLIPHLHPGYYRPIFGTFEFSKDGRRLIFSDDMAIEIWDSATFNHVSTLHGHRGSVEFARFIADGKHAISASKDGTVRLWDVDTSKELLQIISFEDQEWISETPIGYYTSSLKGDTYLNVRLGNSVFGIDQWRPAFYKPDIIKQILEVRQPNAASTFPVPATNLAREDPVSPPRLRIVYPADGAQVEKDTVQLSLHTEDAKEIIQSIKIKVNGAMILQPTKGVSDSPPIVAAQQHVVDLKLPLLLDPGENVVDITVSNGIAEASSRIRLHSPTEAVRECARLPNLWLLAIGVDHYRDTHLDPLKYAAADAKAIVDLLKKEECKQFRSINDQLVNDDSTRSPTYDNVLKGLSFLTQAGPRDLVVLFFAGHGTTDAEGRFYFLPSDSVLHGGTVPPAKAISWPDLKPVLDLAAKKIFLIDACHSGNLNGQDRLADNGVDRFLKEIQESRPAIFSSTGTGELADELPELRHGVFTYALLEGLMGRADFLKQGTVQLAELDTYVRLRVPDLSKRQHPTIETPPAYKNLAIATTPVN